MSIHQLNYLDQLEAESIYILREVAGQFERPALLFSGGKDSIVLAHLARKAFFMEKSLSNLYMLIPDITFRRYWNSVINW